MMLIAHRIEGIKGRTTAPVKPDLCEGSSEKRASNHHKHIALDRITSERRKDRSQLAD
jgi:hypothetical protein